MADLRYFLMSFKVQKTLPSVTKPGVLCTAIITQLKSIQAQTEIEAKAKFEREMEVNEKYLSHENLTIQ